MVAGNISETGFMGKSPGMENEICRRQMEGAPTIRNRPVSAETGLLVSSMAIPSRYSKPRWRFTHLTSSGSMKVISLLDFTGDLTNNCCDRFQELSVPRAMVHVDVFVSPNDRMMLQPF